MIFRKIMTTALSAVLLAASLSGCGGKDTDNSDNTLTINLGTRNCEMLIEGLEKKFPDIDFEITPAYCANQSGYLRKTLTTGSASDIFYYTQKPDSDESEKYLLDLSSYDFIGDFDRSVINTFLVDGRIYSVPGPMALRGMAYNKTLFEEHGWERPGSHRELVELCRKIRSETDDITPISMSMGGVGYPFTLVTTLSQAGFLGTPAGEEWEKRFKAGNASVAEGWGEGLEMTAELIDAGAFNVDDYIGVWDGDACKKEFMEGKAAMFAMWGGQSALLEMMENSSRYQYAFMPFYGKEDGELTIGANSNMTWSIPKRLGEPGNEKKLKNALRVMEWFSTQEAQDLMKTYMNGENGELIPTSAEMIPLVSAGDDSSSSPYFRELWEQAEKGNKMPMIYSGYESVIINAGTIVQNAMLAGTSEGMADSFINSVDSDYKDFLNGGEEAVLFEVTDDFNEAQTAQLAADGLYASGFGDFALVTHTGRSADGVTNLYGAGAVYLKGTYNNHDYNIIVGNMKNIVTLSLTGKQVKQLLSEGKKVSDPDDSSKFAYYPYYWSGIDAELSEDGAAVSVRLNGTELADDLTYKVVFCGEDYPDELKDTAEITDTEVSFNEYWLGYISSFDKVSPPEVLRK